MVSELRDSVPDDLPPIAQVDHLLPFDLPAEFAFYHHMTDTRTGVRDDGSKNILRANRARLRRWLSTNIPIQYNKMVENIQESCKGMTVHFQDGSSATGDILVGADGIHSITRKHIFKGKDEYIHRVEVAVISVDVDLNRQEMEEQLRLGHSAWFYEFDQENGKRAFIFAGLNEVAPDGQSGKYFYQLMWPEEAAAREGFWVHTATKQQLYQGVVEITKLVPPQFRTMVEKTNVERIKFPPIKFSTVLIPELPAGRVTLLGDAAHGMTPFRGEGGVHALKDAMNLAKVIEKMDKHDELGMKRILVQYQEEMLARGGDAAQLSRDAFKEAAEAKGPVPRWVGGRLAAPLPQSPQLLKMLA
ncbi:hypothetical protein BX600DRAFT_555971 [Xylariales sp. PMI_506]|nr:hypothetical protein BX600DRAFT_555971 [Xylariales sp. PMI_506]